MKKISILFVCFIAAFGCESSFAQVAQQWSGSCRIQFNGKSTLHDFTGNVTAEPFLIAVSNPTDPVNAAARGRVVAKAAKMDTQKPARDRKMYKVMGTGSFPDVVVDLGNLTAAATKPVAGGPVPTPTVIPFDLTIKGKTKKTIGKVSNWNYTDSKITFRVAFPVSLTSYGIKPPSVVGIVKVEDMISVTADVSLSRK
ncbi:MAG: YceI family protein [Verrucomicrobiales bacterium]|nr:YceI family protein [Verrucomicrobiales bacterium]